MSGGGGCACVCVIDVVVEVSAFYDVSTRVVNKDSPRCWRSTVRRRRTSRTGASNDGMKAFVACVFALVSFRFIQIGRKLSSF